MPSKIIIDAIWSIVLILFLSVAAAQLSERLKNKAGPVAFDQPSGSLVQPSPRSPIARVNALLGSGCILLAAFWGFDVLLGWWMYARATS